MPVGEALQDSIAELYDVFRAYPLNHGLQACPCCHDKDAGKVLISKKLSDLSAEDLYQYSWDAILTWGSVDDFKHFLPRVFEVLTGAELASPYRFTDFADPEVVSAKLRYGKWWDWPAPERNAISRFFHHMLRELIESPPNPEVEPKAGEWLCVIGQAEESLASYLEQWLQNESVNSNVNLANTILNGNWTKQGNAFWGEQKAQYKQVEDWMGSVAVYDKLSRAYERWPNAPFSEDLYSAATMIK